MILLCGIPSESPLAMVARALDAIGADYRFVNQRMVADCAIAWCIDRGTIDGTLRLGSETHRNQRDVLRDLHARRLEPVSVNALALAPGVSEGSGIYERRTGRHFRRLRIRRHKGPRISRNAI